MAHVRVYPHNDLFNLANYHKNIISDKVSNSVEDSICLDCLSCLIALAFSVESMINFVGHKRITNWQERQPFRNKLNAICDLIGTEFNITSEPFRTIWELKEMRDMVAHGQPFEGNIDVSSRDELRQAMECPWDQNLNPEYINHAYGQVQEFETQLLTGAGISVAETLTSSVPAG